MNKQTEKKCTKKFEERERKSKNNNYGITLIALVITVIVLLILAGISIAMLSGENGILNRATEAKENTERASVIEQARTDILGQISENKGKNITKQQFRDILNIYFDNNEVSALDIPDDTSTSNDELTSKEGSYKIKLTEIYSGMFEDEKGLKVGDDITIGTEKLKVLKIENGIITAIPYYNITLTTDHPVQDSSYPSNITGFANYNGKYWTNQLEDIDMNGANNIQQYIEAYQTTLESLGATNVTTRIARYQEMYDLTANEDVSTLRNPGETGNFWLGTSGIDSADSVYYIVPTGAIYSTTSYYGGVGGVRPLVIITE